MSKSQCGAAREVITVQSIPTTGPLAAHLGPPLAFLRSQIGKYDQPARSYVLSSVKLSSTPPQFVQHGSAPNFQGGVLTLCTCKHQMRSSQTVDQWPAMWIAGFTSRTLHGGRHWLFYLAVVKKAFESHAELWQALDSKARNAKAADKNYLGDVFRPKGKVPLDKKSRFAPQRYETPSTHAHRKDRSDRGWKKDIGYQHARSHRRASLLLADPKRTYLWESPRIYLNSDHCRDFAKWSSATELVAQLREVR